MIVNRYMMQTKDGTDYYPVSLTHANSLIEKEIAEWVGTDGDEDTDIITHYADRRKP